MTIDISALNNATFDELHSSLLLSGPNAPVQTGTNFVVSPLVGIGLANYDNWTGIIGSPDPADLIGVHTFFPTSPTPGILEYTNTNGAGVTSPSVGGVGAEIIAANSTGYLLEQLSGYVPGANPVITPDGTFFILSAVDLSYTDGSAGPTTADLTFSTTFGTSPVPEPSTALLMPVMVVALMVSRIPGVRSFLRAL